MRRDVTVMLYRPTLSLMSGAGQLIEMQAQGLRAAGARVEVAAQRGTLKFWLRTGTSTRRLSTARARRFAARAGRSTLVVDHGACVPSADVTFVHNLHSMAQTYSARADWIAYVAEEARFFRELRSDTPIVANSKLVKSGLVDHFDLSPERVIVHYPGYRSDVFAPALVAALRAQARRKLGLDSATPLVGLVTSGDFRKRGLEMFLATAAQITAAAPDVRFLVVGSKHLPEDACADPLVRSGRVAYRPKSRCPQLWMSALDVFLYPAVFEEFGMVVAEAQALGVPVLTSRLVGAAECLPDVYSEWLIDEPRSDAFAERTLALLGDSKVRNGLTAAALASVVKFDRDNYISATVRTILDQKR
jgi:glycosyltransferase involved in cell wall biosynthesis